MPANRFPVLQDCDLRGFSDRPTVRCGRTVRRAAQTAPSPGEAVSAAGFIHYGANCSMLELPVVTGVGPHSSGRVGPGSDTNVLLAGKCEVGSWEAVAR